jgi:hypothetical protein
LAARDINEQKPLGSSMAQDLLSTPLIKHLYLQQDLDLAMAAARFLA